MSFNNLIRSSSFRCSSLNCLRSLNVLFAIVLVGIFVSKLFSSAKSGLFVLILTVALETFTAIMVAVLFTALYNPGRITTSSVNGRFSSITDGE